MFTSLSSTSSTSTSNIKEYLFTVGQCHKINSNVYNFSHMMICTVWFENQPKMQYNVYHVHQFIQIRQTIRVEVNICMYLTYYMLRARNIPKNTLRKSHSHLKLCRQYLKKVYAAKQLAAVQSSGGGENFNKHHHYTNATDTPRTTA